MGDLDIRDWLTLGGFVVSLSGLWYKIHHDTQKAISEAIKDVDETAEEKIGKLKDEISAMKANMITRHEHERDLAKVSQEVRAFRDEIREDIRILNSNLTTRLDTMMQHVAGFGKHKGP